MSAARGHDGVALALLQPPPPDVSVRITRVGDVGDLLPRLSDVELAQLVDELLPVAPADLVDALGREITRRALARWGERAARDVAPCLCECTRGGFCGGCGHAGCGRRR
jgi:hypothetical protein